MESTEESQECKNRKSVKFNQDVSIHWIPPREGGLTRHLKTPGTNRFKKSLFGKPTSSINDWLEFKLNRQELPAGTSNNFHNQSSRKKKSFFSTDYADNKPNLRTRLKRTCKSNTPLWKRFSFFPVPRRKRKKGVIESQKNNPSTSMVDNVQIMDDFSDSPTISFKTLNGRMRGAKDQESPSLNDKIDGIESKPCTSFKSIIKMEDTDQTKLMEESPDYVSYKSNHDSNDSQMEIIMTNNNRLGQEEHGANIQFADNALPVEKDSKLLENTGSDNCARNESELSKESDVVAVDSLVSCGGFVRFCSDCRFICSAPGEATTDLSNYDPYLLQFFDSEDEVSSEEEILLDEEPFDFEGDAMDFLEPRPDVDDVMCNLFD